MLLTDGGLACYDDRRSPSIVITGQSTWQHGGELYFWSVEAGGAVVPLHPLFQPLIE